MLWQLVFGLLQQLSASPAIVVERNMFAYYKVPLKLLAMEARHTNESISGLYYVLQCPPKLDDNIIPKPKDMLTCNVVDQYKDIWHTKSKTKKKAARPSRIMVSPLPPPPPAVRRMQWGWRQRRSKRQDPAATATPVVAQDVASPLQYLGQPHRKQKLLKLAADHRKFNRGSRTKGYQHMYHRDETYNDHIFYDELKLDGKFDKRGKSKTEH